MSDVDDVFRKFKVVIEELDIELKPIMFINAVKGVSEGMSITEAVFYGLLSGYTEPIHALNAMDTKDIDRVLKTLARIMG